MSDFDWVKNMQNGGGRRPPDDFHINIDPQRMLKLFWLVVGLLVLMWGASSSYYTVEANEEAVVLRLGEIHDVWTRFPRQAAIRYRPGAQAGCQNGPPAEFGYEPERRCKESVRLYEPRRRR